MTTQPRPRPPIVTVYQCIRVRLDCRTRSIMTGEPKPSFILRLPNYRPGYVAVSHAGGQLEKRRWDPDILLTTFPSTLVEDYHFGRRAIE